MRLLVGCTWDGTASRIAELLQPYVRDRCAEPIVLDGPLPEAPPQIAAREDAAPLIHVPEAPVELSVQPLSL